MMMMMMMMGQEKKKRWKKKKKKNTRKKDDDGDDKKREEEEDEEEKRRKRRSRKHKKRKEEEAINEEGAHSSLTLCILCNFACFLSYMDFFKLSLKKTLRNTIRVSNSLDPDQAWHFVGPNLDPNCLQRLSENDKSRH